MSIDLSKFWLGLDMPSIPQYTDTGYPRYNVIESKGNYRIEVAVPGWRKKNWRLSQRAKNSTLQGRKSKN